MFRKLFALTVFLLWFVRDLTVETLSVLRFIILSLVTWGLLGGVVLGGIGNLALLLFWGRNSRFDEWEPICIGWVLSSIVAGIVWHTWRFEDGIVAMLVNLVLWVVWFVVGLAIRCVLASIGLCMGLFGGYAAVVVIDLLFGFLFSIRPSHLLRLNQWLPVVTGIAGAVVGFVLPPFETVQEIMSNMGDRYGGSWGSVKSGYAADQREKYAEFWRVHVSERGSFWD